MKKTYSIFILLLSLFTLVFASEANYSRAKNIISSSNITKTNLKISITELELNKYKKNKEAQVFLAMAYDYSATFTKKIIEKEFFGRKSVNIYNKIIRKYPKYAFVYASYGLTLSQQPDFLKKKEKAVLNFEKAYLLIPVKKRNRTEMDWEARAYLKIFYIPLLKNMIKSKQYDTKTLKKKLISINSFLNIKE